MLTIEMKINGTLIGQIYAHNEGYTVGGNCKYMWHCYLMSLHGEPSLKQGTIEHLRADGFTKLGAILMEAAGG